MIYLTSVSELTGKQVITTNAFNLGEVEGAEFDPKTWKITDLHVKLTNEAAEELEFKKPMLSHVVVLVPVSVVKAVMHVVTLSNSSEELKNIAKPKKD